MYLKDEEQSQVLSGSILNFEFERWREEEGKKGGVLELR